MIFSRESIPPGIAFRGGAEIGPAIDSIIAKFNPQDPSASVPDLLALRSQLATLPASRLVEIKRRELDHMLQNCVGLNFETTVANAEIVPGETIGTTSHGDRA